MPLKGEACPTSDNKPPQIIIEMDVPRMLEKGLKLYVDGNENVVSAGDQDGRIPISFFESCRNAKNKEELISFDDINRVRGQEDAEEAQRQAHQERIENEKILGFIKGAAVKYKPTGELATIAQVHTEDASPYYTILFPGGREKQTVSEKLDVLTEEERMNFSPVLSPRLNADDLTTCK